MNISKKFKEERIEIVKHPTDLEDVAIYKQQVQEMVHIVEPVKMEKLKLEIKGDSKIKHKKTE